MRGIYKNSRVEINSPEALRSQRKTGVPVRGKVISDPIKIHKVTYADVELDSGYYMMSVPLAYLRPLEGKE